MQAAADLTEAEREALIERCPEQQRWAFRGWLEGRRDLAGDLLSDEGVEW